MNMKLIIKTTAIMGILSILGCSSAKDLPTVQKVNLQKYTGLWYEIARLPNSFEDGLECITAEYSLNENGTIKVINSGYSIKEKGKLSQSEGIAKVPNPQEPGRLKVSFFRPFWGKYYIFELEDNYQYALVGSPSRKYFWILSRTKQLDELIIKNLLEKATNQGFDVSNLIYTNQNCSN